MDKKQADLDISHKNQVEQLEKISNLSADEAKELLSNIGGQTELPERYDIDILQRLVGELKIEADFNDAMDVS